MGSRTLRQPVHSTGLDTNDHIEEAGSSAGKSANMVSPSAVLDVLILTFNCAKNFVEVPVFATHLGRALTQNAAGLPDVVVM